MCNRINCMSVKKIAIVSILLFLVGLGVYAGKFYYQNLRGIGPAINKPVQDVSFEQVDSNSLFALPPGFSLSVFAKAPGARVEIFDNEGNLWVSQTSLGQVSKIQIKNGQAVANNIMFRNLNAPHGLAFDLQNPNILYIAEATKISKVDLSPQSANQLVKIINLPKPGLHFTRTLAFGPGNRLYVSIGSTCNVCQEPDDRYAAIYSLKTDGTDLKPVAKGLRNTVFFIFNNGKIWGNDMGRDLLGDNAPPDELNVISVTSTNALNFGWPICYGSNVHDTDFDKRTYIRNPCQKPFELASHINYPAHSAPLGLAFAPNIFGWPAEYQNNIIVAFHGSWNRSAPTGYKVVRLVLDDNGNLLKQQDFITGWLTKNGALGRPVDVLFDKNDNLFITDDKAGVIYKVSYKLN